MNHHPIGSYRVKIHPHQPPSQDTLAYIHPLDRTRIGLGLGNLALREGQERNKSLNMSEAWPKYYLNKVFRGTN